MFDDEWVWTSNLDEALCRRLRGQQTILQLAQVVRLGRVDQAFQKNAFEGRWTSAKEPQRLVTDT